MAMLRRNIGFDGRIFLAETEWQAYCRRKPVRYIRRRRATVCQACGLPGSSRNPLQQAHLIPFDLGIVELGLTPDFLDSEGNIVTAHRRACNKRLELTLDGSMMRLKSLGIEELPRFLPDPVHMAWSGLERNDRKE